MKEEIGNSTLLSCGKLLIQNHLNIALAESAIAGRISAEFAMAPDTGKFLKGGIVCYDANIYCTVLGVTEERLQTYTTESETVTSLITMGLPKLILADIHIGCTGLTVLRDTGC